MKRILLAIGLAFAAASQAVAQTPQTVRICNGTQPNCPLVGGSNPLPVTGTFTAAGFSGNGSYATLTATASSSASTALPTGTSTRITNASSTATVSCTFATGAATGLVSNILVPPLSSVSRVNGSFDHIACIDQTGSTGSNLVVLEGGSGLGNDTGGGGGSGGGSVTQGTSPWVVFPGGSSRTLSAWNSGTALNATQIIYCGPEGPGYTLQLNQTTPISAGATTLQGSNDTTVSGSCTDGTWVDILAAQVTQQGTYTALTNPYTLTASTNQAFGLSTSGFRAVRIKLSTAIVGAGTVTGYVTSLPYDPIVASLLNPITGTVTATLLPAEVHAAEVGWNQTRKDSALTVTASSAYAAGNAVGGLQTLTSVVRVVGTVGLAGTGGIIQSVALNSKSLQTTQFDIFYFNDNPTGSTCTDKTNFVLATADFDKVFTVATIPSTQANGAGWFAGGTGSVGVAINPTAAFALVSSSTIYACVVARGTPTFAATTDLSVKTQILRD